MRVSGISCYLILVKEQFREYLTLFWNVLAPTIAFAAINIDSIIQGAVFPGEAVLPYIGFSILSITLYSLGVFLLTRREDGFFSSITQTKNSKIKYLTVQLASIYTVLLLSLILLLVIFRLTVSNIPLIEMAIYMVRATWVFVTLSVLFSAINCLPANQKSAYSFASFVIMFSILGYYFTQKNKVDLELWQHLALLLNPLTYCIYVLENGISEAHQVVVTLVFLVVGLSLVRYSRFSPIFRRA